LSEIRNAKEDTTIEVDSFAGEAEEKKDQESVDDPDPAITKGASTKSGKIDDQGEESWVVDEFPVVADY
jgi:hypothetical protein